MKIAFVSNGLYGGGSERTTVNLANGLSKWKQNEIFLLSAKPTDRDYKLEKKVNRLCVLNGNIFHDVRCIIDIQRNYKFNVIISLGIYQNICLCIYKLTNRSSKIIISERNAPLQDNISKKSKVLKKLLYNRADGCVFQTKQAMNCYNVKLRNKSVIIHNPIIGGLPDRSEDVNKEIVAIGRIEKQKNYSLLIKAFSYISKKYPDYRLRIFGNGGEFENIYKLCAEKGIDDKVIFEGFTKDCHSLIIHSDIYVLTSDFEGLPNALMEAMAMGFPCVSTDCPCGGPGELIKNGVNGILVPVNDVEELSKAISKLIMNRELNHVLSTNAKKIRNDHSLEYISQRWMDYIIEIQDKA